MLRKSYNDMYSNETVIQRNKVLRFLKYSFGSVYKLTRIISSSGFDLRQLLIYKKL